MSDQNQSSSSASLRQALDASAQGDSAAAVALFQQAINEDPASAVPQFLLGSEYAASGENALAEEHFSLAVLLRPEWHVARYQLGLLQFTDGRVPAALLTWTPLQGLEDSSPFPHWIQGFAALVRDDFDAARGCFQSGLDRNLDNPAMSLDIQRVLAALPGESSERNERLDSDLDHAAAGEEELSHVLLSNYSQRVDVH